MRFSVGSKKYKSSIYVVSQPIQTSINVVLAVNLFGKFARLLRMARYCRFHAHGVRASTSQCPQLQFY